MTRMYRTTEQIVRALRDAQAQINAGKTLQEVCRQLGVHVTTYYYWRNKFANMEISEVKRLKSLEKENGRLKKLVAELSLDNAILKEAVSGNY